MWLTAALLGQHPLPPELAQRVGDTLELSGDGIMSAINFNLALERGEAESGPRVRINLDGKWLPYQWKP